MKLQLPLLESRCFKGRRVFDSRGKKAEKRNVDDSRNGDMSQELADPEITFKIFAASPCLIKMDHVVRNTVA